jgi:hypothetical protein
VSRKAPKPRIAWEDRFQQPGADDLLTPFHKQHSFLLTHAREGLSTLGGVVESIEWRGVPWRWSFVYRIEDDGERPWAYLVPQPGKPILALPLDASLASSSAVRRMSRGVRDTILFSTQVGGVCWPQWELSSRPQLEEVLSLAKRKHDTLLVPTPAH